MKTKAITIIRILAAAFTAAAVNTFLHPCRGHMAMKCQRTAHIGAAVLAVIAVVGIIELIARKEHLKLAFAIISAGLSAAVFFTPLLGYCGSAMMHCNTHTMPAFRIAGIVLLVLSAASTASQIYSRSKVRVHEGS